jgi:hypothetical protein
MSKEFKRPIHCEDMQKERFSEFGEDLKIMFQVKMKIGKNT